MRRSVIAAVFFLSAACWTFTSAEAKGSLIVVGGGGTPDEVFELALALSGGSNAVIAVIPQASLSENRGVSTAEFFLNAGAREAVVLENLNDNSTKDFLARSTLVWMPGGSQSRLMEEINAAGLSKVLKSMHDSDVNFGGTSAGAAVLSQLMITGDADLESVTVGGTVLSEGLGLWPEVIVDQHALKRRRFTRLLAAVMDHSDRIGVAIDEKTAVVVNDEKFQVYGESTVLVIDGREAVIREGVVEDIHSGTGLRLHVLTAGQTFNIHQD